MVDITEAARGLPGVGHKAGGILQDKELGELVAIATAGR